MPYMKQHKTQVGISVGLSFILAAIQGAQVKLIRPLFDHGLNPEGSFEDTFKIAATLFVLALFQLPTRFFHFYLMRYAIDSTLCAIRNDIFKKMQHLPTQFYTANKQGVLTSHMLSDATLYSDGIRGVVDLVREPLKALAMITLAIMADWQLTCVILLMTPLFLLILEYSGKKMRINQGEVQEKTALLTHQVTEGISGHKTIKAFNLKDYTWNRFHSAQKKLFATIMKGTFVKEIASPTVECVGALSFSCVIVFAHYRIVSGAITTGDFISFIAALALLMDPIRKFSTANVILNQAHAAGLRILHLFSLPEEKREGDHNKESFHKGIFLNQLSFNYEGGPPILHDLSLKIEKGKKVAFVGLSGAGKSTLINLLLGLYKVGERMITIDDKDINSLKLNNLRRLFGFVGQDIFLFHASIRENLVLGENISDTTIKESLKIANALEFVEKLPKGVDTVIGDRGANLSMGQQQRLTIARAWLKNPPILIFDEATSSLDYASELLVQKALEQAASHKTVIAVAHRLTSIKNYDHIFVLKDGSLVEEGTHFQLMDKKGEYARLYQHGQTLVPASRG